MLPQTRPIDEGFYEVRFRDVDAVLRLRWNGKYFMHGDKRVRDATLLTWRGQW